MNVFLVDDHELVRRGLRELLQSAEDITVTGEASNVAEALQRIPLAEVNVAVIDVRLPDGNGIELCREILSEDPSIRCLILTSYDDDQALESAILAGASGYLLKQIRGNELIGSIRKVGEGGSLIDPKVARMAIEHLHHKTRPDSRIDHLTAQERKILSLLAEGKTNRQIGAEMFLAEKTVKNYVSNVLNKMGFSRRTEAAVYAARLEEKGELDTN
ncbi:MAG: response regulator transcription factor [Firmicutes bacterium]|jgi:DNA-binding NarL/FixJ family response regulator|nr:response regulator transcription factor [Bacillota bacterium]